MREIFPRKKKGDPDPGARHINDLGDACSRASMAKPGSFLMAHHGEGGLLSMSPMPSAPSETARRWAVVDFDGAGGTDYEENGGDPRVSVTGCNRDGSGVVGDSFYIYVPRLRGEDEDLDPSVYFGDVLSYELDIEGTPICASPYLWCAIGDLKYRKTDRIPRGWREVTGEDDTEWDARGRVLMARDEDGREDENAAADEGGYRWHGLTENNHSDHIMENAQVNDDPGAVEEIHLSRDWPAAEDNYEHDGPSNEGDDTDNRMRYKVAVLIERYK